MKISLVDVDGHHFPNLALMKLSAWHKAQGDRVEWHGPLFSAPARAKKYPQSVDEVLEIAADPRCAEKCTHEQARDYFLARDTRNWVDARGRKINPGKVYGDLKIWLLRDAQTKRDREQSGDEWKQRTGTLAAPPKFDENERGAKK